LERQRLAMERGRRRPVSELRNEYARKKRARHFRVRVLSFEAERGCPSCRLRQKIRFDYRFADQIVVCFDLLINLSIAEVELRYGV